MEPSVLEEGEWTGKAILCIRLTHLFAKGKPVHTNVEDGCYVMCSLIWRHHVLSIALTNEGQANVKCHMWLVEKPAHKVADEVDHEVVRARENVRCGIGKLHTFCKKAYHACVLAKRLRHPRFFETWASPQKELSYTHHSVHILTHLVKLDSNIYIPIKENIFFAV